MRTKSKSKNFKSKTKTKSMKGWNTGYGISGKPEESNSVQTGIGIKALKNLYKSSYSIKVDPYQAANETSTQYPLLNGYNKVSGGNYNGEHNIDGGNVQQYANSLTSNFLKSFDVFRTEVDVNYRYLPVKPVAGSLPGKRLTDEMIKSISEALSVLRASTYTSLAINDFVVSTDMPMGSYTPETIDGVSNVYTNSAVVIYAMSVFYQIFLQECISTMSAHNAFRTRQGIMMKNGFNREVPQLNSLFGLFNKKSFLNNLESINLSFEGEYVDYDWMQQITALTSFPSRRSNSINDPLLELTAYHSHPTFFKIYTYNPTASEGLKMVKIFDMAEDCVTTAPSGYDISDNSITMGPRNIFDICEMIKDRLSVASITKWARTYYKIDNGVYIGDSKSPDNQYFNMVSLSFSAINDIMTKFKPKWADFRECLDIMRRTGVINWQKGLTLSIIKDTDMTLTWNVTLDHIYQLLYSGPTDLTYNEHTTRLQSYSLWHLYSGIPDYDVVEGGAFLAFSFKNIESGNNPLFDYLPLLFSPHLVNGTEVYNGPKCVGISRDGFEVTVEYDEMLVSENMETMRLAPLSTQSNIKIRIPTVSNTTNNNSQLTVGHKSNLTKTLAQIFGYCRVQSGSTDSDSYHTTVDPDVFAIYQFEFNDITNAAISYARYHAPFRGTIDINDAGKLLGFKVSKI